MNFIIISKENMIAVLDHGAIYGFNDDCFIFNCMNIGKRNLYVLYITNLYTYYITIIF